MINIVKKVGAYEAKTHLPALLAQVAKGREILITKRERPIARLIPVSDSVSNQEVFKRIRSFRKRVALDKDESTRDLIDAGRRI